MKRFVAILLILVLDSGKTSPQTGESFSILWVILAAVAAVGAVLFCGKKLVRAK